MSKNDPQNDYCDLDPTKICDNCCKCIDNPQDDYKVVLAQFEATEALLGTDYVYEDESYEEEMFGARIPYEHIDPALVAEWEEKLRAADAAEHTATEKQPRHKNITGVRRRKEKDDT